MSDKNVQLKDLSGNTLNPKTKAAVVYNDNNEALGGVEAGAQVNIIESIEIDGVALEVSGKTASYTTPTAVVYSLHKVASTDTEYDSDYAAQYYMTADGTKVGDVINLPKDMVISAGELKECTVANAPINGLAVGDPYLELTIANNDGTKIYIPVKGLVDIYTAGNGLDLNNGQFSVDTTDTTIVDTTPTASSTKFVQSGGVKTELDKKENTFSATHKLDPAFVDTDANNRFVTDTEKSTWSGKQDAITSSAKLDADLVDDSESTHKFVTATDKTTWNGKQDAITGAATSITSADLTASKILVSDANGKVAASSIASNAALLVWEELS